MEDHRLKSYCLVVETKSFSRAAQAKHMTQSAMSRLVKNLEYELGVKLLHREGKASVPTPEGRRFYGLAKKILAEYAKIKRDLAATTGGAKASLRLGASTIPALYLLPQVIYDFSKAHPRVLIDLSMSGTENVLRHLQDGRIELGIIEGTALGQAVSGEVVAEDEIIIIAPEDHPLAKKKTITFLDLASEPFILPDRDSASWDLANDFFREAGVTARKLNVRMTLGSPELIVQMVQAGLGIAFASKWSVFKAAKEGTVKQLRVAGKKMKRNFYLIGTESNGVTVSTTAVAFREFLKEHRFFVPF
jgi:DNA-binding transcriptional LysR family regulator